MKKQTFQPGEIRDEQDNIIRPGAYGKKTALVTADNVGILDYIINNFDALKDYADGNTVPVSTQADLPAKGDAGKKYVTSDTGEVYYYDGGWKELKTEIEQLNAYDAKKYAEAAAASKEAAASSASAASSSQKDAASSAAAAKAQADIATQDKDDIAGVKEAVEAAYHAMLFDITGPPPEEMSNGHFIVGAGPAVM